MSRSSRHKEKLGKHGELSHVSEETAARTRPLSFDEIMHGRKNKDLSQNVKEETVDAAKSLGDGIIEKVSDHYEYERRHNRHHRDSSHGNQKLRSEVYVKDGPRKKEESNSREERPDKHRSREDHSLKTKIKAERRGHVSESKMRAGKEGHASETKMRVERQDHASETKMRVERHDHASDIKMRVERQGHASETKMRAERRGHASETKMRVEMKKGTSIKDSVTTDKQIRSWENIHERTSNAPEIEVNGKRLRSLVVMDGPRDESSRKSDKENKRKYQNGDDQRYGDGRTSKKLEPRKVHNIEISEREEKMEQPKVHHYDKREKRRESRSRDHGRDRERRSSLSPRAQKITSHHRQERGEFSLHDLKDRSGEHHSDKDRNKTTTNGSSRDSKWNSGSRSGLGGYSPRKRRSEAPMKTPSPPNRSPEKKSAKWDLAPTGIGSSFPGSVLSGSQSAIQIASFMIDEAASTIVKPITSVSFKTPPTKQSTSVDPVQLTESTRPLRRLYVGNVPDSVSDKSLMEYFNNYLLSSGFNHIQGSKPCISCIMHKENGQALVEFLTPEDASSALYFDGCSFAGSILKIRRPKDFVELATGELEKTEATTKALSVAVMDSPNKIFIGGISKNISSEMLMEIVSVFGPLKAYCYKINEDLNEPCIFLEYVDQSVTLKACAGLNGMKLGGNVITAVQASPDASFMADGENSPFNGIPEHAKPLLNKPTQVLKLKNVFDPDVFSSLSQPEVEEILEDVRIECARFGTVKSINMVKDQTSNVTTTVGACACDDTKRAGSDKRMTEMETSESPNNPSEDANVLEVQRRDNETEEVNNTMEAENPTNESPTGDTEEDQLSRPCTNIAAESTAEPITEEHTHDSLTSKVEPDLGDENLEDVEVKGKTDRNKLNSDGDTAKSQEDSVEKVDNEEQEHNLKPVFEAGSVFVEYVRLEASCMAAHSLHGRLFDDRVVTVEYVSVDLYLTRFRE